VAAFSELATLFRMVHVEESGERSVPHTLPSVRRVLSLDTVGTGDQC